MQTKLILQITLLLSCVFSSLVAKASVDKIIHPFYVGIMGGYGSTTWGQLVPPDNKAGVALSLSTPTSATEGGAIWGLYGGYEFIPQFALEAVYSRYPTANVYFDASSLFSFEHNGRTEFSSKTDSFSASAKFMLYVPRTPLRVFSTAGVAGVHRSDVIANRWRATPTFGVGVSYNITDHIMAELGMNYTAGYGESELDPAEDYVPFLYSAFARLAYRFG